MDPKLSDEPARLAALRRYEVLDTPREDALDRITSLVRMILGVPISAISLIDEDRQWFKSIHGLETMQTTREESFCTHTIRTHDPMVVPAADQDDRFSGNVLVTGEPFIQSYAGAPLKTPDGYNIGALCAIDTTPRQFSGEQVSALRELAALVVEHLELRRAAEHDQLTGALSRRALIASMNREIARFARHRNPAVLLMFDIDHFKSVNDTYGHPVGDAVLEEVVRCCRKLIRPSDYLGRLGGEEFGLLLTETTLENGLQAAERFRCAIADLSIGEHRLKVSASFGLADLDKAAATAETWLARADQALYAAKRQGRNRCEVHSAGATAH